MINSTRSGERVCCVGRAQSNVSFLAPIREYVDSLIHPSVRHDLLAAARHRAFIAACLMALASAGALLLAGAAQLLAAASPVAGTFAFAVLGIGSAVLYATGL